MGTKNLISVTYPEIFIWTISTSHTSNSFVYCILNRGHEEGAFENGICRSIMRCGLGSCIDAYNQVSRDYYIEELFALN